MSSITLMFEDIKVLMIDLSNGQCGINDSLRMPFNLSLREGVDIDTCIYNLREFERWCANRTLSMSKANAKKICNAIGISQGTSEKTRAGLALAYRCLSLDDAWWTKRAGEDINWEQVSLHKNSARNVLTPISLRGEVGSLFNGRLLNSSDLSVNGTFAKSWVRKESKLYLYKADEHETSDETLREVLASNILDCFNVKHVQYIIESDAGTRVTRCKCFTTEKVSFIPWRDYKSRCLRNGIDPFNTIREDFSTEYANMIVASYLIGNEDLHDGNWGFLLDNETFKLIGLCPLFDFNYAMTPEYISTNAKGAMCIPETKVIDRETGKELQDYEMYEYDYEIIKSVTLEEAAIREMANASIQCIKPISEIKGLGLMEYLELQRRMEVLGLA